MKPHVAIECLVVLKHSATFRALHRLHWTEGGKEEEEGEGVRKERRGKEREMGRRGRGGSILCLAFQRQELSLKLLCHQPHF